MKDDFPIASGLYVVNHFLLVSIVVCGHYWGTVPYVVTAWGMSSVLIAATFVKLMAMLL